MDRSDLRFDDRHALSIQEAAQSLGVGLTTMKKLVTEKRVASFRIGKRVLIAPKALDEFVRNAENHA